MNEIHIFRSKNFVGKGMEHHSIFLPSLQLADELCEKLGIKIHVTSSYRKPGDKLSGAIVKPASASNHFIGCAFDCNFQDDKGVWWNSTKLKRPSGKVLEFITEWKGAGYRWGGDFSTPDVVHFDNCLNLNHPETYKEIYLQVQGSPVIRNI